MEETVKKLEERLNKAKEVFRDMDAKMKESDAKLAETEAQLRTMEQRWKEADNYVEQLKNEKAELIETHKNEKLILEHDIDDAKGYIDKLSADNESLNAELENVKVKARESLDKAKSNIEQLQNNYDSEVARLQEVINENLARNKELSIRNDELEGLVTARLTDINKLNEDISKMNEIPFGYNTAVTLIEFDDKLNFKVIFYDDASHITDELIKISEYTADEMAISGDYLYLKPADPLDYPDVPKEFIVQNNVHRFKISELIESASKDAQNENSTVSSSLSSGELVSSNASVEEEKPLAPENFGR
jgi:DNA repair exonuclease SbcCD ATPase subunit